MAKYVRDAKTGRKRLVDRVKSRIAKLAAKTRSNKNKPMSAATKRKIALGRKKAMRTGRTRTGRRSLI